MQPLVISDSEIWGCIYGDTGKNSWYLCNPTLCPNVHPGHGDPVPCLPRYLCGLGPCFCSSDLVPVSLTAAFRCQPDPIHFRSCMPPTLTTGLNWPCPPPGTGCHLLLSRPLYQSRLNWILIRTTGYIFVTDPLLRYSRPYITFCIPMVYHFWEFYIAFCRVFN